MRYVVLLVVVLSLVPSFLQSQLPPQGYVGLFADDNHSSWCVQGVGFYPVEMWMWCLPSYWGQICVEFGVHYPANVIRLTITGNTALWWGIGPGIMCEGDICYGSICYIECQWDWHWVFHQTLYVMDPTPSYCQIIPHPDVGVYQFANCEPGFPVEPCKKYTNLYFNYDPEASECQVTAAESLSWGSIKSMFE
jgi:hypothetical protein